MGRWLSPDKPFADQHPANPQSWNLYSYVRNNPLASIDDDGQVTIELRYSPVAVGYHTYIVITDTNGHQSYYRAGPSQGASGLSITPATGGKMSQSSGSNSNSYNSTSPGSGKGGQGANTGPWGALTAEHGDYTAGTIDHDAHPPASLTILSNDQPAAGYLDLLNQYEGNVNQANIPYNPLSTNSNAYADGAVEYLGLTIPKQPVTAVGHDTPLPVPSVPPPPPPPCSVAGACSN